MSEISDFCPLSSSYDLSNTAAAITNANVARDFYALTHHLLTDVSTVLIGDPASVSGDPIPNGMTTDDFITLTAIEAGAPP